MSSSGHVNDWVDERLKAFEEAARECEKEQVEHDKFAWEMGGVSSTDPWAARDCARRIRALISKPLKDCNKQDAVGIEFAMRSATPSYGDTRSIYPRETLCWRAHWCEDDVRSRDFDSYAEASNWRRNVMPLATLHRIVRKRVVK